MEDKKQELRELIDDAINIIEMLKEERRKMIMVQNSNTFRSNVKDIIVTYDKNERVQDQEWFQSMSLYDEFDILVSKTKKIKEGGDKW